MLDRSEETDEMNYELKVRNSKSIKTPLFNSLPICDTGLSMAQINLLVFILPRTL